MKSRLLNYVRCAPAGTIVRASRGVQRHVGEVALEAAGIG